MRSATLLLGLSFKRSFPQLEVTQIRGLMKWGVWTLVTWSPSSQDYYCHVLVAINSGLLQASMTRHLLDRLIRGAQNARRPGVRGMSWPPNLPRFYSLRADSIGNNPIPEWQSRIGVRGSFYERPDPVCATVFGIDFFARIFGRTGAWSRAWREVVTCMSSRQRQWLDDSIPSARLFRIQI